MSMTFMDFEKPLEALYEQLQKLREVGEKGELDVSDMVRELEGKIENKRKEIYSNLTGWQKVQLSRHPERPYTLYYLNTMCQKFIELHGDRYAGDDHAIVGGLADLGEVPLRDFSSAPLELWDPSSFLLEQPVASATRTPSMAAVAEKEEASLKDIGIGSLSNRG